MSFVADKISGIGVVAVIKLNNPERDTLPPANAAKAIKIRQTHPLKCS